MSPGAVATVAFFLFVSLNQITVAQLIERTEDGVVQFTHKVIGKWDLEEIIVMGSKRTTRNADGQSAYGHSVFTANTWTRQSSNGDLVFELSDFNESSDPLEVKFVQPRHRERSIAAFMLLEDGKLTIVYGSKPQYPIPLPKSVEPGPETAVFKFKRSDDESAPDSDQLLLALRLLDGANILVDVTIKPLFNGKLRYPSEQLGRRVEQGKSTKPVIVVDGSVVPMPDGSRLISLIVEIGSKQHSDDPRTTIVRSEKLQITTVVTPGQTARIKCGEDRTCELTLEVE